MTTATAAGYVEMRIAKAVGLAATDHELSQYVVLEKVAGDRHLAIEIGWPRPSAWRLTSMGSNGHVR